MKLTKQERKMLEGIKKRTINDYKRMNPKGFELGYMGWQTWKLCELIERLSK